MVKTVSTSTCIGDRLEGAIIRVGPNSDRTNPECGTISIDQINADRKVEVTCDLEGQYLSIELPGRQAINLCEIQAAEGNCGGTENFYVSLFISEYVSIAKEFITNFLHKDELQSMFG